MSLHHGEGERVGRHIMFNMSSIIIYEDIIIKII